MVNSVYYANRYRTRSSAAVAVGNGYHISKMPCQCCREYRVADVYIAQVTCAAGR